MLSVIWSGAGNSSEGFLLIAAVIAVSPRSWSPYAVPRGSAPAVAVGLVALGLLAV